jgi:hypothetical protein
MLVPNSFGDSSLREFNPCHDPKSGRFSTRAMGRCTGVDADSDGDHGDLDDAIHQVKQAAETAEERTYAKEIAEAELEGRAMMASYGKLGTKSKYFDSELGAYTPERKKVHDKIINDYLDQMLVNGKWEPRPAALTRQENPVAIFMGGMTASGKTTSAAGLKYENKLYINSDDLKMLLPEWSGNNAAVLHEESSDIADTLFEMGRASGYNLVMDSTMKSLGGVDYDAAKADGGMAARVERLRSAGYRIEVRFTDVDVPTSISRSIKRYISQKEKAGKGRYVPVQYIKNNRDPEFGTIPRRTFEQIKPHVDAYVLVDNRGKEAKIVDRSGSLTEAAREKKPELSPLAQTYINADAPTPPKEMAAMLRFAEELAARREGSKRGPVKS